MKKFNKKFSSDNLHYLKIFGIVLAAILFYAVISNLGIFFRGLGFIWNVFIPVTLGLSMAFVLNMPLRFFENKVFGKLTRANGKVWSKLKRPLCLALSVLTVLSLMTLLLSFVIPQFISTCADFFLKLPEYMDQLSSTARQLIIRFNLPIDLNTVTVDWSLVSAWALELFDANSQTITQSAMEIISGLVNGIFNVILGFVISIYVLASKEKLGRLAKSILYSFIKRDTARKIISVVVLSNKAFTGFVSGQCVEVGVIGVLCFIGMLIFRFPHALMVSCIIAVTAFIPIFGGIIGAIIGAFLILLVDPIKAVWFLIFIIILQQLESHIIYPKMMGKHVSLPGIWVLLAVTVGGGLFGVLGIIISVPLCSVLHTLLEQWIIKRLEERNICHRSMSHDSSEPNSIIDEIMDEIEAEENSDTDVTDNSEIKDEQ